MFEKHLCKSDILSKEAGLTKCLKNTCGRVKNVTLPQVFFKYFASKNQLPGLSINGALVENGLIKFCVKFTEFCVKLIDQSENLSL